MIAAKHNRLGRGFVRFMYRALFRWHFRKVVLVTHLPRFAGPALLIGNHVSWWDGFFADHLNAKILNKRLYIMMLEEQLASRNFLRWAGAFSIRPGSRDALRSMQYAHDKLTGGENLVVIFPQGEIHSLHARGTPFQDGIEYFWREDQPTPFRLLFYAALPDYFSHARPTVYLYLEEARVLEAHSALKIQEAYDRFFLSCILQQQKQKH